MILVYTNRVLSKRKTRGPVLSVWRGGATVNADAKCSCLALALLVCLLADADADAAVRWMGSPRPRYRSAKAGSMYVCMHSAFGESSCWVLAGS